MRDAGESGGTAWGSPEWAARREVEVLKLLCDGNVAKMKQLWLRKQLIISGSRQHAGGQPRPKQQGRAAHPVLEPIAQPKQRTQAQDARRARSQKQLRQKHLASKIWACVRIAVRLQAWRVRATAVGAQSRCREPGAQPLAEGSELFGADGRFLSVCGGQRRVLQHRLARKLMPASFSVARPATVAAAIPAAVLEAVAASLTQSAIPPAFAPQRQPTAPALPAPPPASLLAAPAPPSQQQLDPGQLAAAARANLDESELQDNRGSKRVASARTPPPKSNPSHPNPANQPPPPPPGPKKSRGGAACSAALAAAAPSPAAAAAAPQQLLTATTYAAAALAAANPRHTSA